MWYEPSLQLHEPPSKKAHRCYSPRHKGAFIKYLISTAFYKNKLRCRTNLLTCNLAVLALFPLDGSDSGQHHKKQQSRAHSTLPLRMDSWSVSPQGLVLSLQGGQGRTESPWRTL